MKRSAYPWKSFLKKIAAIAIPVALQNLLTTTGSMVDTMMIASIGQTEVGAVGLCAQFSSLMFSGYWGFVGGGMLFFSQFFGAKDDEGIHRSYGLTLLCMMTVSMVFGILAVAFPELVMRLYIHSPQAPVPLQAVSPRFASQVPLLLAQVLRFSRDLLHLPHPPAPLQALCWRFASQVPLLFGAGPLSSYRRPSWFPCRLFPCILS